MVKVNPFTHKGDIFDDLFLQAETYSQALHFALELLTPDDLRAFHVYSEKRLLKVPWDLLWIEPIREPTPNVSLENTSKENYEEETQERSTHELKHLEQQSQNGGGNTNKDLRRTYLELQKRRPRKPQ